MSWSWGKKLKPSIFDTGRLLFCSLLFYELLEKNRKLKFSKNYVEFYEHKTLMTAEKYVFYVSVPTIKSEEEEKENYQIYIFFKQYIHTQRRSSFLP